jgi:hypothetical protein
MSAGDARFDAKDVVVGSKEASRITVDEVELELSSGSSGWQLVRLWFGRAEVTLAKNQAVGAGESTRARLRRLADQVRGGATADRNEDADGSNSDVPPWLARLAPNVQLAVESLEVRSLGTDGTETILEELEATVRGQGGQQTREFKATGQGDTESGGSIRWNLDVQPLEARVEGTLGFDRLSLALVAPLLPSVPWHEPERAWLDGELVVQGESASRFDVRGRVHLVGAAIDSERVAEEPVHGISVLMQGKGTWLPLQRRLEVGQGSIEIGQAKVNLSGALEWAPDHYLFDFDADLPSTKCGDAVGAIPDDLLGELTEFTWDGALAGSLSVEVDSRALDETTLDIDVMDSCTFVNVPEMADLSRIEEPFTHTVEEPDDTVFEMETGPGSENWVPLDSISPLLVHAVLAHEDAAFFEHAGFAPWAIEKALTRNLQEGGFVLGASTVTMQLAKNLFLRREKKLARKVQEVLLTWWLEHSLEKPDILELYLNIIEYGPELYGIGNATRHYFGRPPSDVSPAEAVFIATILPDPKDYHDQYERERLSRGTRNRMKRQLENMFEKERIDAEVRDYGLAEIEEFSFHKEGDPPPEPREIPPGVTALPYEEPGPAETDGWFEGPMGAGGPGEPPAESAPGASPGASESTGGSSSSPSGSTGSASQAGFGDVPYVQPD